jgi:UDP-glucuronate decarboxylase
VNYTRPFIKRILVTGAAGFIGSHLCERLLNEGHEVVGVDNFYTGTPENILGLLNRTGFSFFEHDVSKPFQVHADQIYNLACAASPKFYQAEPIDTMKTSFLGALHTLEIAKAQDGQVLLASTSEVYGDPLVHPQPESYWGNVNPFGARACYDEGKRAAEALCYSFQQQHGLNAKVSRIFNTYGPRMRPDDGRVISNFVVQALTGEPLTIYGSGNQTRSFCYVDDLVAGLIKLMNSISPATNAPLNLGNPAEFTVMHLAELVLEMTRSKSRLVFQDLPSDDPKLRQPDISAAKEVLDWEPLVQLKDGLKKTIDYFDKSLSGAAETKIASVSTASYSFSKIDA